MPSLPAVASNATADIVDTGDTPPSVKAADPAAGKAADTPSTDGADTASADTVTDTATQTQTKATTPTSTSDDPSTATSPSKKPTTSAAAKGADTSAQDAPPSSPTDTAQNGNQIQNPGTTSTEAGNPANANAGAATKDTASASLTVVSTDAAGQTQSLGAFSNTASGLSATSGISAASIPPTDSAPLPTFTGSGTDTQTQTQANIGLGAVSAASSPSSSATPIGGASSGSNSNTSFFANKPTVIGIFTAGGLVAAIFLIYVLMRLLAARKRRRLDREMDDAFRDTMESAKDGWRVMAGLEHDHGEGRGGEGVRRAPSVSSVASAGSLSYSQPPLAVAPQASYYNYGYEPTYAPDPAYAPAPVPAPMMGMGMGQGQGQGPTQMGMGMGQMAQHAYPAQTYAQQGLARGPSQSAVVELHRPGGDYLSNYTAQPVLPNPFDGGERAMMEVPLSPGVPKVLKVANE